jgi:hypothetical protein
MKPVHVGLLVLGAAVAGTLAVKMSQAPAIPPTPGSAAVQPAVTAPSVLTPKPAVEEPAVVPQRAKPSPLVPPDASSSAPSAVYTAPPRRPVIVHEPIVRPYVAPQRRVEIAQAKPLEVPPLPPDAPPQPAQPQAVAPKTEPPAAPPVIAEIPA